ncbi:isoprenylcysteine carboxylmethyltransferase family protein [bacterium]|nr:isoprenylcysteine carboxylmethyltransferase family protein [bacterium]
MKENRGEHPFGDAGQLVFLLLFLLVWITDSFVLHLTTGWARAVPPALRLMVCLFFLVPAFFLMKSGHRAVEERERPAQMITTGAFRLVRHPLYLSSLMVYMALTGLTGSLLSLALLVPIWLFFDKIAEFEEGIMVKKFGNDYLLYRNKTGRWLPRRFSLNVNSST